MFSVDSTVQNKNANSLNKQSGAPVKLEIGEPLNGERPIKIEKVDVEDSVWLSNQNRVNGICNISSIIKKELLGEKEIKSEQISDELVIKEEPAEASVDSSVSCLMCVKQKNETHGCNQCSYKSYSEKFLRLHTLKHTAPKPDYILQCKNCCFMTLYHTILRKHVFSLCKFGHSRPNNPVAKQCVPENVVKCKLKPLKTLKRAPKATKISLKRFPIKRPMNLKRKPKKRKEKIKSIKKKVCVVRTNKYKCDQCDFETILKKYYRKHLSTRHQETLRCYHCSYETTDKRSLACHCRKHYLWRIKNGRNLHKCEVCGYATNNITYIKSHMRVHKRVEEIDMYKCDECSYQSRWKWNVVMHKKIHLRVKITTKQEIFKCYNCSYQSKWKANVRIHQRVHQGKKRNRRKKVT